MMESCRIQGVARRGGRGPRYHGGNTGVDVAANMRRDGWTWNHPAKEAVRGGAGLRRCEIVMLNSFRRLLSNIATLNGDIGRWAGAENLPQPNNNTRINMFAGRANGGPPTGINEYVFLVNTEHEMNFERVPTSCLTFIDRFGVQLCCYSQFSSAPSHHCQCSIHAALKWRFENHSKTFELSIVWHVQL